MFKNVGSSSGIFDRSAERKRKQILLVVIQKVKDLKTGFFVAQIDSG